jgi:hypothetical protein
MTVRDHKRGLRCPFWRFLNEHFYFRHPGLCRLLVTYDAPKGFKVDISRGQRIGRVSSEWLSRPDDERYLSLSDLYSAVRSRADRATARTVESRAVRVEASRDNAERPALVMPGRDALVSPTHWSFGQLCSLVGAPSGRKPGAAPRQTPVRFFWHRCARH